MFHLLLAAQLAAGSYTFTAARDGQTVGTSQVTIKANGPGLEIDEASTGVLDGQASSGKVTYVLGADLSALTYNTNGSIGTDTIKDSASVTGSTANVDSAMGGSEAFTLIAPATKFVVIDLGAIAGFVPLAAQMAEWKNPDVTVLVPMYGMQLSIEPQAASVARPAAVPANDVAIAFGGHAPFTMWYDPATLIPDEIDVPSQDIIVTRKR